MDEIKEKGMDNLIVDAFAGGGGASVGIEMALGRSVDIAINHDPEAIRMHTVNHPGAIHLTEDIFEVDLKKYIKGRHVALMWASPDCTSHSKAKGSQPRKKGLRILPWAVYKHAKAILPDVIIMENVEEIQKWGPLDEGGHPIKSREGEDYNKFINAMKGLGYQFDSRELVAADYGAPTTRKRWYAIFRKDGRPIMWPVPTHSKGAAGGLLPWEECGKYVDWSDLGKSIFGRKKPLAEATMKRIANGMVKYVVNNPDPYIVKNDEAYAFLIQYHGEQKEGDARGQSLREPVKTIDTSNRYGLVVAFVTKYYKTGIGQGCEEPIHTITTSPGHFGLISAFFIKYYGTGCGQQATRTQDRHKRRSDEICIKERKMKIGLLAVDSHNFPNLALMKLSAYHKREGDEVEFVQWQQGGGVSLEYDRIYMSKIFTESKEPEGELRCHDVRRGGSGYDLKNKPPDEIEHIYPDYSLYPELTKDTAYGWLTRGCPRCNHSSFCITPEKDGRVSVKVADLSEFWNGQKNIILYDQNILACKDRINLLDQLARSGAYVEFNGGMDVRYLNDEVIEALRGIRVKDYHFAWDDPRENLIEKFQEFTESGLKKPRDVGVYVLVNHWSTHFEDLYRIYTLRAMGYMPFVMIYDKQKFVDSKGHWLKGVEKIYTRQQLQHFKTCQHMQRWCGNRRVIKATPNFEQYERYRTWKEAGMPVPGWKG